MNSNNSYAVHHFLLMAELAERLALTAIPVLIIEHVYNYKMVGCWWLICERGGRRFRVFYDGKEFSVFLEEQLPERNASGEDWKEVASRPVPVPVDESLCGVVEGLFNEAK